MRKDGFYWIIIRQEGYTSSVTATIGIWNKKLQNFLCAGSSDPIPETRCLWISNKQLTLERGVPKDIRTKFNLSSEFEWD